MKLTNGEAYVSAWVSSHPFSTLSSIPSVPSTLTTPQLLSSIYDTHDEFITSANSPQNADYFNGQAGWKMGAVGLLPGVPCLCGPLFNRFIVSDSDVALDRVFSFDENYGSGTVVHTLEGEVGFVMKRDVSSSSPDGFISIEDLWDAVDYILPCIEVCGSRFEEKMFKEGKINVQAKLADGLMCAGVITGRPVSKSRYESSLPSPSSSSVASSLRGLTGTLLINSKITNEGPGTLCPENGPLESMAWLANHLVLRGKGLKKGELVISGAIVKCSAFGVGMNGGDHVLVDFGSVLGQVKVKQMARNEHMRSKL